jgi:diguanylate cyclase (GGDEF)-like protein
LAAQPSYIREEMAGLDGVGQPRWVLDRLPVGLVLAEPYGGSAAYANRAWTILTGQDDDRWFGQGWLEALDPSIRADQRAQMLRAARDGRSLQTDWSVTGGGSQQLTLRVHAVPVVDNGRAVELIVTAFDLTPELELLAKVTERATHDALTGLYNRAQFVEFVRNSLERLRRGHHLYAAVMFIDVDHLKDTNDRHGHEAGDRILTAAAQRILGAVRAEDVVARYGGDEFTVLCDRVADPSEAFAIAERITSASNLDSSVPVPLHLSIGVSIIDGRDTDPTAVIYRADQAMYDSRRLNGRPHGGRSSLAALD